MEWFWNLLFYVLIGSTLVDATEKGEKGKKKASGTHNSTMELIQPVMAAAIGAALGKKMNVPSGFEQAHNTTHTSQPTYSGVLQDGAPSHFQTNMQPNSPHFPHAPTNQFQPPPTHTPAAMLPPQPLPYHGAYDPRFPSYSGAAPPASAPYLDTHSIPESYLDTSQNYSNEIPIGYPPPQYAEPYTSSQFSTQSFGAPLPTNSTYPPLQFSDQSYSEVDPKAAKKFAKIQKKERKEREKGHKEGKYDVDRKEEKKKEKEKEKKKKKKPKKDKQHVGYVS